MNIGTARERVRVARALPALPKILASFRIGKVSFSKVRAMTRVATTKNEEVLLNVALHGTATHVETQVRMYRKVKRIEALQQENPLYPTSYPAGIEAQRRWLPLPGLHLHPLCRCPSHSALGRWRRDFDE